MKHVLPLCLLLALVLAPSMSRAQVSACYEGTCYPSLSEAEAAMRADPLYGNLMGAPTSTLLSKTATNVVIQRQYDIDNRPPERFYSPGFQVGGKGAATSGCTPSESSAAVCADETWIVAWYAI